MRVYNCKDRKVARVIASQNITKLNIDMNALMIRMGLYTEKDIEDLIRLRSAKIVKPFAHEGVVISEPVYDDNVTQIKALELTLKLKGVLKEQNQNTAVQNNIYVSPSKTYVFTSYPRESNVQGVSDTEGENRIRDTATTV